MEGNKGVLHFGAEPLYCDICTMLSTSCKYALRAVVYLVSEASKRHSIKDVALAIDANEHTTAKILQLLAKSGIIKSAKGPTGGFYIDITDNKAYLIDVVRLIDGDHFFYECGLGLKQCSDKKPCPIHAEYKLVREQLFQIFSTVTIQQLSQSLMMGKAFLKL